MPLWEAYVASILADLTVDAVKAIYRTYGKSPDVKRMRSADVILTSDLNSLTSVLVGMLVDAHEEILLAPSLHTTEFPKHPGNLPLPQLQGKRGVTVRKLYDLAGLDEETAIRLIEHARASAEFGISVRVRSGLAGQGFGQAGFICVDRKAAMLAMSTPRQDPILGTYFTNRAMVDALASVFENLWAQALDPANL